MMKPQHPQFQVHDRFYSGAKAMRQVFEQKFADPLVTHNDRFVWDYWHVPKEYTLLRTPAPNYFPRRMYESFHRHLVLWGRENLGCHDISPPWLSCYIQGCRQEPHQDVPHGPLAYVFSLTPWWQRVFSGGDTFLRLGSKQQLIASEFNRLVVFYPALVHGVRELKGTHDPRQGRLVIHGWFVNPRPFWYGPLTAREISEGVERGLESLSQGHLSLGQGLISLRMTIQPDGSVVKLRTLVNTLRDTDPRDLKALHQLIGKLKFKKRRTSTQLTLPLMVG